MRRKRQFSHKSDIGLCGQQRFGLAGGRHFLDDQLDLGKGLAKPSQGVEQRRVVRDGHCSHSEPSSDAFRYLACVLNPLFQFLECAIGSLQKGVACWRQVYLAFATGEQAETQFVFQAVNGLTQGWLRHVQANRGFVKMQLFSHRDELPEQSGFDHFSRSFI